MIYFVLSGCKKYIKIGCTDNLGLRMKQLQTANPLPLKVLFIMEGSYQTEANLHQIFDKLRIKGGEWFSLKHDLKCLYKIFTGGFNVDFELKTVKDLLRVILVVKTTEAANSERTARHKDLKRRIGNIGG